MERKYITDILGTGFYHTQISLRNDYTGQTSAILVRKLSNVETGKAILYIHGFNDYFFQGAMANWFNEIGFHFYALDLRREGLSLLFMPKTILLILFTMGLFLIVHFMISI